MREISINRGRWQRRFGQGSSVFAYTVEVEIKCFISLITHKSIIPVSETQLSVHRRDLTFPGRSRMGIEKALFSEHSPHH